MNDQHLTTNPSRFQTESIKEKSAIIHKKLGNASNPNDPDIIALQKSFRDLMVHIGLSDELDPIEKKTRLGQLIDLLMYVLHRLIDLITALYHRTTHTHPQQNNIESALIDEYIDKLNAAIPVHEEYTYDETKEEIISMIKSLIELVKIVNNALSNHRLLRQSDRANNANHNGLSDTGTATESSLSISGFIDDIRYDTSISSIHVTIDETNEIEENNNMLVPIEKDEILERLNQETFFKTIDALFKSNLKQLKSDKINISVELEHKLLPMMAKLKQILHDYQPNEAWALRYRQQKRKIVKKIHPDMHSLNNKKQTTVISQIIHSLFEAIDKLINKLVNGESINTYDEVVESLFEDIMATFKEAKNTIKKTEQVLKETELLHQEAREEIKQIHKDYRQMTEETQRHNKFMDGLLSRLDTRINKLNESSQETERILRESILVRLHSDLICHFNKKDNKIIQSHKKTIHQTIASINNNIEDSKKYRKAMKAKLNSHSLFNQSSSNLRNEISDNTTRSTNSVPMTKKT